MLRSCVAALLRGHTTLEICFNTAELIGMAEMQIEIILIGCAGIVQ